MAKKQQQKMSPEEESLFGLLTPYKGFCTYFSFYQNEEENRFVMILTDNPLKWQNIEKDRYENYQSVKRLTMGLNKLTLKFMKPEYLVSFYKKFLGIKLPVRKTNVINELATGGLYIIETDIKHETKIQRRVKHLLDLSPQRKYTIIEHYIAEKNYEKTASQEKE